MDIHEEPDKKVTSVIKDIALILSKNHYSKKEIEKFFYLIKLQEKYDDYKEKEALVAYSSAISELYKMNSEEIGNIISKVNAVLIELEWKLAASQIKNASGQCQLRENEQRKLLWNIPKRPLLFIGREEEFGQIDHIMDQNVDNYVPIVFTGFTGTGKTSLAIEYIWRNKSKYKTIAFFSAESVNALEDDILRFGNRNNIIMEGTKDLELIIQWFQNRSDWLIVFDNANSDKEIENYFPSQGGKIIITSQNRNTLQSKYTIELDNFNLEEVGIYLKESIPNQLGGGDQANSIEKFSQKLEYLPLAVTIATSYIRSSNICLVEYLRIHEQQVYLFSNEGKGGFKKDFIETFKPLYESILMSVRKAYEKNSKTLKVLKICAFLYSERIPKFLFEDEDDTLYTLIKYNFIVVTNQNNDYFSIHRSIQEAMLFFMRHSTTTDENSSLLFRSVSEELKNAYDLIESFYPFGKIYKEDLILKYDLLHCFSSLLNHYKLIKADISNSKKFFDNFKPTQLNIDQIPFKSTKKEYGEICDGEFSEIESDTNEEFSETNDDELKVNDEFFQKLESKFQLTIAKESKTDQNTVKFIDALEYLEMAIHEKNLDQRETLLFKSLDVMREFLDKDHQLIADLTFRLIFIYIEKAFKNLAEFYIWFEKAKELQIKEIEHIKIDNQNELTQSFKFESCGFFKGMEDERIEQFDLYLRAFEYQMELLNKNYKGWTMKCASIFAESLTIDENKYTLNNLVEKLKITLSQARTNKNKSRVSNIFDSNSNFSAVLISWIRARPYEVPQQNMFYEILKHDLHWDLFYEKCQINDELSHDSIEAYNNKLHVAASVDDIVTIKALLAKGAKVNQLNKENSSPLHLASFYGFRIPKLLLSKGANLNAKNNNGLTPLHIASSYNNVKVVKLILEHNCELVNLTDITQKTALHFAAKEGNVEIGKMLLANGADLNALDENGCTPLHYAAETKFEFVKLLLDNSEAQVNCLNHYYETPLHMAIKIKKLTKASIKTVQFLINKGVDLNARNNLGRTPLHIAAQLHNSVSCVDLMQLLFDHGNEVNILDSNNKLPIHIAAQNGNLEAIKWLLERGQDVNGLKIGEDETDNCDDVIEDETDNCDNVIEDETDNCDDVIEDETDNCDDVIEDETDNCDDVIEDETDNCDDVIDENIEVAVKNELFISTKKYLKTPLHYAAENGHDSVVEYLLKNKALVDEEDDENETPLFKAIKCESDRAINCVRLLIESKAKVEHLNINRRTPLDEAIDKGNNEIIALIKMNNS